MSEKNSYENLPLVQYTFSWPSGPSHVSLCGQFDLEGISNWSEIPLEWQDSANCFQLTLLLSGPKHVDFKFVVDGEWVCSPHLETRPDSCGFINNYIFVEPTAQAVESKATTPETLVEIQPEEAKWCESPPATNENNTNEKNCEYKDLEKMVAEEKSPLILPTEVQECPEKHANLELNLNTLDAFEYQFMGFREEQDNDSSDSSCISPSSSEDSINLSHKESSSDSINISLKESETDNQLQCFEHTAGGSHMVTCEDLDVNSLTSQATDIQCAEESGTNNQPQCSEHATEESQMMSYEDLNVNSLISHETDIQCAEESETDDQPQCSEHATEESQMISYEGLNVNSLISHETDIQCTEESETDDQLQCSEHTTGGPHLMTCEDLDVNSLTSQATDIQCAEESGTDNQPQCSEHATEESQMMSYEDLNVNSLISQETDTQYADESNENNEECETKAHSDSDGEPEEPENDQVPEDTKSSQETQEDTVVHESDAAIDKAANQLRNEALAADSPNSTLASEQVEFTRSQFFEQHVEDDESKPSIPMVLCSLTLSYIFYGLLAVSTIAAKKSLTIISSKVLDVIQNHSKEAVKMTEAKHTAYEVHELNIFEILMGLTLVASGMIVAYVVSSFKSRT